MTAEKRKELIAALIEERRGYVLYGNKDDVAGVDAELARLGLEGSPPARRSAKRVTKAKETR